VLRAASRKIASISILLLLSVVLVACGPAPAPASDPATDKIPGLSPAALAQGEKLRVVATTSIVADVVRNVGGESIELTTLMPPGTDPHSFDPTPQDAAAIADADVVFISGAGLERFLEKLMQSAGENAAVVPVSCCIELRQSAGSQGEQHGREGQDSQVFDPHTWFDPGNVVTWVRNIERALTALDPERAAAYHTNAEAYVAQLEELDAWIRGQVAQIPQENRKLVTDHLVFGYFAQRYGFAQVGTVFPGYSTMSEPSVQELVSLEDSIREFGVKAVFVGITINPDLAERVAEDTGIRLVFVYTGSLSGPAGPANSYLAFMRYDVTAIVDALR